MKQRADAKQWDMPQDIMLMHTRTAQQKMLELGRKNARDGGKVEKSGKGLDWKAHDLQPRRDYLEMTKCLENRDGGFESGSDERRDSGFSRNA